AHHGERRRLVERIDAPQDRVLHVFDWLTAHRAGLIHDEDQDTLLWRIGQQAVGGVDLGDDRQPVAALRQRRRVERLEGEQWGGLAGGHGTFRIAAVMLSEPPRWFA